MRVHTYTYMYMCSPRMYWSLAQAGTDQSEDKARSHEVKTGRQADGQTDRQTDRQTHRQTDALTNTAANNHQQNKQRRMNRAQFVTTPGELKTTQVNHPKQQTAP